MAKALVLGGATGLLGQALVTVLRRRQWDVETLSRTDGDLLNMAFLEESLARSGANVIFNAVGWTKVDDAEDHQEEAMLVNATLPDALARLIRNNSSARLVHFSTDFVFSGQRSSPWTEDDEPSPVSVYGRTKLAGEKNVLASLPERSIILRTAWLFGPGRKNFVTSILAACDAGQQVKVVQDQFGSPTYTIDLAEWSVKLAEKEATGLWHAVNSGQASWCELAAEAVALTGKLCRVTPIDSSQWPQKARRPAYSVLGTTRLARFLGAQPRPWPQALRSYLFSSGQ